MPKPTSNSQRRSIAVCRWHPLATASAAVLFRVALFGAALMTGCQSNVEEAPRRSAASYDGPDVKPYSTWRAFYATATRQPDVGAPAGTAFAVKLTIKDADSESMDAAEEDESADDSIKTVLLTATHTIDGRSTPVDNLMDADAICDSVHGVLISETYGANSDALRAWLPVNWADTFRQEIESEKSFAFDVCAVRLGKSKRRARPLMLAHEAVQVGDRVWLATAVFGGASPSRLAHEAEVTEVQPDGKLAYRFVNSRLSLRAADGAALLNPAGEVVAMHLCDSDVENAVEGIGFDLSKLVHHGSR